MKNYSVKYDLKDRSPKTIYVSKNSSYKVSFDAMKDGERCETIKLYEGEVELSSSGVFHDEIQFDMTAPSTPTRNEYKVVADDIAMQFNVIVTDSDVAELPGGQGGGGEETDPVFSEWKGGTKVAAGSTAAAVGDNSAAYGFHSQGIGASSLALGAHARAEGQGSVQIGQGTNANNNTLQFRDYTVIQQDGKLAHERLPIATDSDVGGVMVGDGLSVDEDGVLSVDEITVEESDPLFTQWRDAQIVSAGNSSKSEGTHAVAIGMNAEANGSDSVALGYNAYVDGSSAVQLGQGVNETNATLQFMDYQLCDEDGYIPEARLGGLTTATLSGTYDDGSTFSMTVYSKN